MVVFPSLSFYMLGFRFLVVLSALSLAGISRTTSAQSSTWLRDTIEKRGWQYVTTIDSVGFNGLRPDVFGDTILFRYAHSPFARVEVSINGGKTIDHEWRYPQTGSLYDLFQYSADPIELKLPAYPPGTTSDSLFFTFDLGKTWVVRRCDTSGMNFPVHTKWRRGWLDPTADGTIYLELGDSVRSDLAIPNSYIVRSQDTGKTWQLMNLPDPRCGVGTLRGMLMDIRQHGLWYTMVSDKDLQCPRWYRTADNGEHLECCVTGPLLDEAEQVAGLRYPGEVCSLWRPDADGYYVGYDSRTSFGTNDTILDWVDSLHPGSPHTLNNPRASYTGHIQSHPKERDFLLLPIGQSWPDSKGQIHDSSFWFFSSDAGKHWTNIWSDSLWVEMRLDKRNPGKIMLTATAGAWGASRNAAYGVFTKDVLERREVTRADTMSEREPVLVLRTDGLWITRNTSYFELSIIDVLGRECYRLPTLRPSLDSTRYLTSFSLSAGQYFGVLHSNDGHYAIVPLQIQR